MSLWFLPILLLGVALLTYGAVQFAFGRRRNVGLIFGAAGVIMGLSAPIGALIGEPAPANTSGITFSYPAQGEALDAQDYLLTGTAQPNAALEVLQNGSSLGTITAATDGAWSYYIAAPQPGEYTYEIKGEGGSVTRQIRVAQGLTTASNARCPCQLRVVSDPTQNLPEATAVLEKDGVEVGRGTVPFVFRDLAEGAYTFTLESPGFVTSKQTPAELPKNKNLSVYLDPQR
jgi:hypothetical protein